jgi:GNAT superfamily N-acetyltransferase
LKDNTISYRIISKEDILDILPLLKKLNDDVISSEILQQRILEMSNQNYECLGVYQKESLIGICGLWFQTRHYAGKSMEIDHVIIDDKYRNQGIGKALMEFVYTYANKKQCNWIELNTYVDNFPSHKFYNNQGFIGKGFHFIKKL